MDATSFLLKILLGIAIGAIIGSERERMLRQRFAGLRTFTLVSLFGAMCGLLTFMEIPLVEFFPIIGLIVIATYTYNIFRSTEFKLLGMTTLVVIPLTYLIGVLIGFGYIIEATASAFVILGVLLIGRSLHKKIESLTENEANEIVQFGLILFVLFPLVPKEPVVVDGFVIDFVLFFELIILVSLINFIAFLINRFFKAATIALTGFMGGVINSTVTVHMFARKKGDGVNYTIGGTAAILGSLVRNFILIGVIVPSTLETLLPMFVIIISLMLFFIFTERRQFKSKMKVEQPFSLASGIKLAVALFVAVVVFELISRNLPTTYMIGASFIGGLISSAYTVLSLSMIGQNIGAHTLSVSVLMTIVGSCIVSAVIARMYGSKKFAKDIVLQTLAVIIVCLAYLFLVVGV